MTQDIWKDRERALEESFFQRRNEELLRRMKQELQTRQRKESLAAACGIQDDPVLENLVQANISAETVAALALVPLVVVAWADGEMDDRERKAVLSAAAQEGIAPATVCYELLESWLADPPDPTLITAWRDYVRVLSQRLAQPMLESFRAGILGRARNVARAAGGILGVHRISNAEQRVLDELEAAFTA
jgi:hypothetical protein